MKLLNPSVRNIEPHQIEVGRYEPNFIGRLMGQKPIPGKLIDSGYADRIVLTKAWIDFESNPYVPYVVHFEPVAFGEYLYEGIRPMRHIREHVWECGVENVTRIRVEKPYIPQKEYY